VSRVLVTGAAAFIGFRLPKPLLSQGHSVTDIDAFMPYYDVMLKRARAENPL
jgi:UDP-glucuronate 4-epimerase